MADFRYAQFCPLARAAEVLGERWTLPILRDLFLGPQRFSDLRRRLPGLSSSVLSARLARLETAEIVTRRVLPPPAASAVYELTENGRALEPTLRELMRWGLRFLLPLQPGDHVEPSWVRLGLTAFASRGPTPARSFELRIALDGGEPVRLRVAGGPDGTRVADADVPADLSITADPLQILGLASGLLPASQVLRDGSVALEGEREALRQLPELFDFDVSAGEATPRGAASGTTETPQP